MSLADFLKSSQEKGTLDSEGAFTLGAKARLEGIQKSVSAELGNFALKVVQGLVGSGATDIACVIEASEFRFEAAGCQHPRHGLLSRFSTDIGERRDPTDDLAYAVLGALGVGIGEVEWQLSGGESVSMRKEGSQTLSTENQEKRTVFRFKFVGMWWMTVSPRVRASVHHLLTSRCTYCPVPLTIDSRPLLPAELCGWYKSKNSVVGHQEVIINDKVVINPVTAEHQYRYWGRLDVLRSGTLPAYQPPELGEMVQSVGDGSRNPLSLRHTRSFQAFFLARPVSLKSSPASEGQVRHATIYLLADLRIPGKTCLPVHRGVALGPPSAGLDHPRAVALFDASGLDLDASTLAIAENEKFKQRRVELNRHAGRLVYEVIGLHSLVPSGAAESFDRLSR